MVSLENAGITRGLSSPKDVLHSSRNCASKVSHSHFLTGHLDKSQRQQVSHSKPLPGCRVPGAWLSREVLVCMCGSFTQNLQTGSEGLFLGSDLLTLTMHAVQSKRRPVTFVCKIICQV